MRVFGIQYNLNYEGKFLYTVIPPGQGFIPVAIRGVLSKGSSSIENNLFNIDHQALVHNLEACKLSSNLRAATGTHGRMIKIGYGMHQTLILSLISVYVSCGCSNLASQLLKEIPCWDFDLISANVIIAAFMKIGEIDIAKKVFDDMPIRDVVSWNSMIGGFVKNGRFEEALRIFQEMLSLNNEPDAFTFASVIKGCAQLGARGHAQWIHGLLIEKRIAINYILGSALIDMSSKCGRIETEKEIFEIIQRNDVSVWNAMINGLAVHGLALDAIALFSRMVLEKVSPDCITFVGILTACSYCGLIELGRKYFDLMSSYTTQPQLEHYGAMVDLLGRAGRLDEAYAIVQEMPMEPDVVIWRAFLSACRTQKNSHLGEVPINKIETLKSGDYILLSNIYCSANKWDSAERVRDTMKKNGVRKNSGKSWIEMAGVIHQFKAGDQSHLEREAIYKVIDVEGYASSMLWDIVAVVLDLPAGGARKETIHVWVTLQAQKFTLLVMPSLCIVKVKLD
ncbi:hypothetical protein RHGRI_024683 [Rhododendron griersonianum]|uniref:Pentatricopeptide repeat-containing protein n=1 Tax=Rhododendron griersonianum TaxID=479676 RepID=A0AAV6JBM6_9ERIC|nr:hypothetical protein RHGRI_024683 [Rhododendron griersonianum]